MSWFAVFPVKVSVGDGTAVAGAADVAGPEGALTPLYPAVPVAEGGP